MKLTKTSLLKIIKESINEIDNMQSFHPPMLPAAAMEKNYPKDPDGYEGRMAKNNLNKIGEHASVLQSIIKDDENLEPWVQEKIAVAASMIESVGNYLQYENSRKNNIGE